MTDQPIVTDAYETKPIIKTRTTVPAYEMSAAAKKKLIRNMLDDGTLVEGIDYGNIPGTDKKVLFKPGAEKMCTEFHLAPSFHGLTVIEDFEKGFFHYRYECNLYDIESKLLVGSGIGSCNSMESKYGFRWVSEAAVPSHIDKATLKQRDGKATEPGFGIDRGETTGQYGKPEAYWKKFRDAIAEGSAIRSEKINKNGKPYEVWTIGAIEYAVPNEDIFTLVNTLDKMGTKRAFIAGALITCNASEFFTQDEEIFGISETDADPATGTALAAVPPKAAKPEPKGILGIDVSLVIQWADGMGHPMGDVRKALGVPEPRKIGTWEGTVEEAKAVCLKAWEVSQ